MPADSPSSTRGSAPDVRPQLGHVDSLDGIRALAVLAVYLYHVTDTFQPGGFLGVSTFFTLSGFLITSLLLTEHERAGRIDVTGFWSRRVRRLAPAAFLNIALILGLTVLVSDMWPRTGLGGDTASVIGNVFNWRLIAEGSTDPVRFLSPYSPQWSLAVEEQFYVIFPVLVIGLLALTKRRLSILALCIGGVATSIALAVLIDPSSSFGIAATPREMYRTDIRIGELLAGGALAVVLARWNVDNKPGWHIGDKTVGEVAGWIGLVGSLVLFTVAREEQPWLAQGGLAVVSLASVCLIVGALSGGPLARALSWAPLVWIGRVSYGIYLFHWPIFLVTRDLELPGGTPSLFVVRTTTTLILAAFSYVAVEQPIRRGALRRLSPLAEMGAWSAAAGASVALAFLIGT